MKLVVLASGEGSNLQALLDATRAGRLDARVVGVVANRRCRALDRAVAAGVPAVCLPQRRDRRAWEVDVAAAVARFAPDVVVLAGWDRILGRAFLDAVDADVVNLHPALPGRYPGLRAIERAWQDGVAETGVMVHRVVEDVDAGPVIAARGVPVVPGEPIEALVARVHDVEHALIVEALAGMQPRTWVGSRWHRHGDARATLAARDLDLPDGAVVVEDRYVVRGRLSRSDAVALAGVWADPVLHRAEVRALDEEDVPTGRFVDVARWPEVDDPEARTLVDVARRGGYRVDVAVIRRFHLPDVADLDVERFAAARVNPAVDRVGAPLEPGFRDVRPTEPSVETVPLRTADPDALVALGRARGLSLDAHELQALQHHFRDVGRDPTDAELETVAQTWSEHCAHKTFRAPIHHQDPDGDVVIDGLLGELRGATAAIARPWVESAFVDNAGVVTWGEGRSIAVKVETHNRPSAIEPVGGAATGLGGALRDVLGVSARPVAALDVLGFGPADFDAAKLRPGALHPARVAAGVALGIGAYGNPVGVPVVAGAVRYDGGYAHTPLVFCGAVGVRPTGFTLPGPRVGDRVVVIGGRTGRDGLRGATFSSRGLDGATASRAAVQAADPLVGGALIEAVLELRDAGAYVAVTDCGAGGLSSAVGELAKDLGADVDIERAPRKTSDLRPWEAWLSESQERMVLAVPRARVADVEAAARRWGIAAADLGAFTGDGRLRVRWGDRPVADLPTSFLFEPPLRARRSRWSPPARPPATSPHVDLQDALPALLARPNLRSRESIFRSFDHEVQAGTRGRPGVGRRGRGPGDGAVVQPLDLPAGLGFAVGVGWNPAYGAVDPYLMAFAAVDEAFRNVVAVGGAPDHVALVDNFAWGDVDDPEVLGSLVRCVQGCRDAAIRYGAPWVSGKDSLRNSVVAHGIRIDVPGTLVVTAVARVPDVARRVTSAFQAAGNTLLLIGETGDHLGASELAAWLGVRGGEPPPALRDPLPRYRAVHRLIREGIAVAAHDVAEGGLLVALAEMAVGGDLGADVVLEPGLDPVVAAFAETSGRILVEVPPDRLNRATEIVADTPWRRIGDVGGDALSAADARWTVEALARAFGV